MKQVYFGVMERGADGYGIYFPDLPGCVSGGDTLDHLAAMGAEALQFHINGMVQDGELIPAPTTPDLEAERADTPEADLLGLIGITVDVPTFPKTVEVALDTELVQEVDRVVPNRRQFIMEATRRELDRLKKSA